MAAKNRQKITVIKFGGSIAQDPATRRKFLKELVALSKKEPVILVHGGGPEINTWLAKVQVESRFINGLRYTDEKVLEVVEMVLSGKVNKTIVGEINALGASAVGISGKDGKSIMCTPVPRIGLVGDPAMVNTTLVKTLLGAKFIPVISSLGFDARGRTLNVNADSVAMVMAMSLKSHRLVFLTDVSGVLDENKKTIPMIKINEIQKLIDDKIVTGGMIPKVLACVRAVKRGVQEVWIVNGKKGIARLEGTVIKK